MDPYAYPYALPYPQARAPDMEYPDRGDGYADYYLGPQDQGRSRSKHRGRKHKDRRPRSLSSRSKSRSHSRSKSRSESRERSKSRSRSRSKSLSKGPSRKELSMREPSFLDAFRVLYLRRNKHKKNTTKYILTKKRQDHVQELLKKDGLGSKRWFFYPRVRQSEPSVVHEASVNCDQRVKVDGDFLRKYKRSKKVDSNAPIAKLKRWELLFYNKLGFIQAV